METEYNSVPEFLTSVHYALSGPITLDEDQDWVDIDGDDSEYAVKGTVLGRITTSGLYGPYDDAATDGRQTAVGILWEDVSFEGTNYSNVMMVHGWVNPDFLIGLDANGITDLNAIGIQFDQIVNIPGTNTGSFSGTVVDSNGDPISGATVTLTDASGVTYTTTTDTDGNFSFENLPEGDYSYEIEADGYDTETGDVVIEYDEETEVEIEMESEYYG